MPSDKGRLLVRDFLYYWAIIVKPFKIVMYKAQKYDNIELLKNSGNGGKDGTKRVRKSIRENIKTC